MGKTLEELIGEQEKLERIAEHAPFVTRHLWEWMRRWPQFWHSPRQKCVRCGAMLRYEMARKGRVRLYTPRAGEEWQAIETMPPCTGPRKRRKRR